MTLRNKTYYHIQRPGINRNIWNKGDCLQTSRMRYNAFYSGLLRDTVGKADANGEPIGLIKFSNLIFDKDKNGNTIDQYNDYESLFYELQDNSLEYEDLAQRLHWALLQYLKWIREEIFESVRTEIDNKLPSRKHCIWVCTEGDLQKWWDLFKNNADNKIVELKLDNKNQVHLGDGTLIEADTFSIEEYKSIAKKYWSGKIDSFEEVEYSYEGEFKIINKFNDIKDI